jgi:hypothetical protein
MREMAQAVDIDGSRIANGGQRLSQLIMLRRNSVIRLDLPGS